MKINSTQIAGWALGVFLFALLEYLLIRFVDRSLSEYLRTVDSRYPDIIDFFRAYTDLGLSKWYLWPTGIAALTCFAFSRWRQWPRKKRDKLRAEGRALSFFFACVAISGIVTDILKPMFGRTRPVLLDRVGIYGFHPFAFHANYNSFPSGHTTTAFAIAFALIALWPRGRPLLIGFAMAIAVSRVMVNAHYLSDVCAGAVIGWLTVVLIQKLFVQQHWIAHKG